MKPYPYPYPYRCPTPGPSPSPSPSPSLAPHLRHVLPWTHLPMRAPRPPSCHGALTAHRPPPLRRTRGTPMPALPAVGQGMSTTSQIGSFWHDKHMYGPDLNNQALRQR